MIGILLATLTMDFYRNVFDGSTQYLEYLEDNRIAPEYSVVLPDARIRNPWNLAETNMISRLAAAVVRGKVVPPVTGAYAFRFVVHDRRTKVRLFLSSDSGDSKLTETPPETPVRLVAGRKYALKIHWLGGFCRWPKGNGASLEWKRPGAEAYEAIPAICLIP